jgi:pilus assembly protein Flp/PilA
MTNIRSLCSRMVVNEDGQDLIEYALLAALISVVAVLAISAVGSKVTTNYQNIEAGIP